MFYVNYMKVTLIIDFKTSSQISESGNVATEVEHRRA